MKISLYISIGIALFPLATFSAGQGQGSGFLPSSQALLEAEALNGNGGGDNAAQELLEAQALSGGGAGGGGGGGGGGDGGQGSGKGQQIQQQMDQKLDKVTQSMQQVVKDGTDSQQKLDETLKTEQEENNKANPAMTALNESMAKTQQAAMDAIKAASASFSDMLVGFVKDMSSISKTNTDLLLSLRTAQMMALNPPKKQEMNPVNQFAGSTQPNQRNPFGNAMAQMSDSQNPRSPAGGAPSHTNRPGDASGGGGAAGPSEASSQ